MKERKKKVITASSVLSRRTKRTLFFVHGVPFFNLSRERTLWTEWNVNTFFSHTQIKVNRDSNHSLTVPKCILSLRLMLFNSYFTTILFDMKQSIYLSNTIFCFQEETDSKICLTDSSSNSAN